MNDLKYFLDVVEQVFAREQFMAEPAGLYAPIEYTLRLGGKRIRPTMVLMANAMFDGKQADAVDAAVGIEIFHNFTLLHDDLMDRSPLRRGQPTVYRKWNENTAILSGDTMFAMAWRYFLRHPLPQTIEMLRCFNETAIGVCEGQQYDMDFERAEMVTIEEYLNMIRLKTAVLLAGALKVGALSANAPVGEVAKLYDFGIHLGLAFQLQDDLLDVYGDTALFGKKNGQDIRDNKKTFLSLMAMNSAPCNIKEELIRIFSDQQASNQEEKVERVKAIYDNLNLQEKVEKHVEKEFAMAMQCLSAIGVDDAKKQPLISLSTALRGRKK